MSDQRFDVFLSHNSKDKPAVLAIARALQQAGLEPWLDAWYLRGGDRWQHVLRDALQSSTACAFCYGAHGAGDWHELELEVAHDRALKDPNFRLIPVLLPGLPEPFEPTSLPLFLSTLMWVDLRQGVEDAARLEALVVAVTGMSTSPNGRVVVAEVSDASPYRGLHTFDREHAEFFFGREADVQRLLEKLKASRFLAVVGPSGSGKSSLVRAGLLPALERNGLPGSAAWQICVLKPGSHPLETLALHLAQLGAPGSVQQIIDQLRESDRALHQATSLALLGRPDDVRVLWVIDQAEEVFTLCQDEDERAAFLSNLLYAASAPEGRGAVVLTLRADFYPRLADYPRLAQRLGTDQYLVSPLEGQALRDAIEKPAARAGATFEPGVVDTILTDVETQPGAQPLLEHALQELWQRRRGRTLTLAAYQAIGGVAGALAKSADETFAHLTPEQQAIARRALLRLTQPGEGTEDTRRRAELDELAARPEEQAEVQRVVDALVTARLLTTSGDEQTGAQWVDVAHEALIRGWPRLREWLKEDREYLVLHRRLSEAAHDWRLGDRDTDLLYRGVRLAEAQALAEGRPDALNPLEREFVAESEAFRDRERVARDRLRKRIIAGSLLAAVVALAIAAFAGWQWRETGIQKAEAERQAGIALAQTGIANDQSEEANRQAAAANEARATAEAERDRAAAAETQAQAEENDARAAEEEARRQAALARASETRAESEARVALARQLAAQSRAHGNEPDLGLLLAAEAHNLSPSDPEVRRAVLASRQANARLQRVVVARQNGVNALAFRPDGATLASAGNDGTVRLWDLTGRGVTERARLVHGERGAVADVEFAPDGERLASLNRDDASIRFWDAATGAGAEPIIAFGERMPTTMAFSPTGDILASATVDGAIELWDPATGARKGPALSGHEGEVMHLSFSPDGSSLISSGAVDGTIRFWDVATGAPDGDPIEFGATWVGADVSPDGSVFLVAAGDGSLGVWDIVNRSLIGELENAPETYRLASTSFSPDGKTISIATSDGAIYIWDTLTRRLIAAPVETGLSVYQSLAIAPGGETLAFAGSNDTFYLFETEPDTQILFDGLIGGDDPSAIAVSPDGVTIATAHASGDIHLWGASDGSHRGGPLRGHADQIFTLDFNDDGTLLASASRDGTTRVWEMTGTPRPRFVLPSDTLGSGTIVNDVDFSPDGELLVTGAGDGTVQLWRASDGTAAGQPMEMLDAVWAVAFDPQGATVAAADANGLVSFWDVASGEFARDPLASPQTGVTSIRFVAGGNALATAGSDGTIRYWDVRDRLRVSVGAQEPMRETLEGLVVDAHAGGVWRLDVNADGSLIVSTGSDGRVLLWETGASEPLGDVLPANVYGSQEAAFSRDGTWLAYTREGEGGYAGTEAIVWDLAQRAPLRDFVVSTNPGTPALSPDGSRVAVGDWDGRVVVWDAMTGRAVADQWTPAPANHYTTAFSPDGAEIAFGDVIGGVHRWQTGAPGPIDPPLTGHGTWINALAYSPDGGLLASGDNFGVVWVRDVRRPDAVGSSFVYKNATTGDAQYVGSLAFSPDGSLLAVASWGDIVLWDVAKRQFAGAPLRGHVSDVLSLAFSADGRWLASGGDEGAVFVWDLNERRLVRTLSGGAAETISALAFSPEGSLLAVGGIAGSLEVWSLADDGAYILGEWRVSDERIVAVAFTDDGKRLTTLTQRGNTSLWDLDEAAWLQRVCAMANRNLTRAEWQTYIGEARPYRATCPDLPTPPDESTAVAAA